MGLLEAYDDLTTWIGGVIAKPMGASDYQIGKFTAEQDAATNTDGEILGSNAGYAGGFVEGVFEGTGTGYDPNVATSVKNSVDSVENGFSTALSYLNPNPLQNPLTSGPIKTMFLVGGVVLIYFLMKKGK